MDKQNVERAYYDAPERPDVESKINLPIDEQGKLIALLAEGIEELKYKLEPILNQTEPEDTAVPSESTIAGGSSPLRAKLNVNNSDIQRLTRKVRTLIERLDI